MRRLLVSGIPGMGKTDAADGLRALHGFQHLDAEKFIGQGGRTYADIIKWIDSASREHEKVVVTWGFRPFEDAEAVRAIQKLGFTMVWFDGNDEAAHREYARRNAEKGIPVSVSERDWEDQMRNIALAVIESFNPIHVNTFDASGSFLEREVIAGRLLEVR